VRYCATSISSVCSTRDIRRGCFIEVVQVTCSTGFGAGCIVVVGCMDTILIRQDKAEGCERLGGLARVHVLWIVPP
jgi:hypothetical protein